MAPVLFRRWCDAVPKAKCAGLPDSGFFPDYQDPTVSELGYGRGS